jgi:hypothetical protein
MLTFSQSYEGAQVEYGIDPNANPPVNTLTVNGLTWTYRPYGTRENNVVATWETTSDGGVRWWLYGSRSTAEDGHRMWLLHTSARTPRRHPGSALVQTAMLWAGCEITGPPPSDF